jgi:hypothetical protein
MSLAKAVIPPELEERLLATLMEHHPVADEAGSQSSTTVLRLQRAYDELRSTGLPPDVSWCARTRALHALSRLVHTSDGSSGGGGGGGGAGAGSADVAWWWRRRRWCSESRRCSRSIVALSRVLMSSHRRFGWGASVIMPFAWTRCQCNVCVCTCYECTCDAECTR